jgi:hypothetical protein
MGLPPRNVIAAPTSFHRIRIENCSAGANFNHYKPANMSLPRFSTLCVLFAAFILLPAASGAQSIGPTPVGFGMPADVEPAGPSSHAMVRAMVLSPAAMQAGAAEPASFPRVLLGSTVGLVAGAAVGAGVGYLLYQISGPPDADMFGGLFSVAGGAALGGAVGTWAGSRWANDYRGNPWMTAAGSLIGMAGGIGLGVLAGDATESTELGFLIAIPIAITLPALAEVLSSR